MQANISKKNWHIDFVDKQSWLFTGILPHGYGAPNGFCFDLFCSDAPIIVSSITYSRKQLFSFQDNPNVRDYNVPRRVNDFIKVAHDQVRYK